MTLSPSRALTWSTTGAMRARASASVRAWAVTRSSVPVAWHRGPGWGCGGNSSNPAAGPRQRTPRCRRFSPCGRRSPLPRALSGRGRPGGGTSSHTPGAGQGASARGCRRPPWLPRGRCPVVVQDGGPLWDHGLLEIVFRDRPPHGGRTGPESAGPRARGTPGSGQRPGPRQLW